VSFQSVLVASATDPQLPAPPLALAFPFQELPPLPAPPPVHEVPLGSVADGAPAAADDAEAGTAPALPVSDRESDMLDPLHRQRAAMGPPEMSSGVAVSMQPAMAFGVVAAPEVVRAQASLEDLLPAMVRRIQWSGDGRKGTVRMELAAGALAGSTLLVSSDAGRVSVRLDVPPGVDPSGWKERIEERLAAKHILTNDVEVT
jgi:hypothetical protein